MFFTLTRMPHCTFFLKRKLFNLNAFKTVHNAIRATSSSDKDTFKAALNFIE